jgi:hypothetical protein
MFKSLKEFLGSTAIGLKIRTLLSSPTRNPHLYAAAFAKKMLKAAGVKEENFRVHACTRKPDQFSSIPANHPCAFIEFLDNGRSAVLYPHIEDHPSVETGKLRFWSGESRVSNWRESFDACDAVRLGCKLREDATYAVRQKVFFGEQDILGFLHDVAFNTPEQELAYDSMGID